VHSPSDQSPVNTLNSSFERVALSQADPPQHQSSSSNIIVPTSSPTTVKPDSHPMITRSQTGSLKPRLLPSLIASTSSSLS